jgi:hypothetical protein
MPIYKETCADAGNVRERETRSPIVQPFFIYSLRGRFWTGTSVSEDTTNQERVAQ